MMAALFLIDLVEPELKVGGGEPKFKVGAWRKP